MAVTLQGSGGTSTVTVDVGANVPAAQQQIIGNLLAGTATSTTVTNNANGSQTVVSDQADGSKTVLLTSSASSASTVSTDTGVVTVPVQTTLLLDRQILTAPDATAFKTSLVNNLLDTLHQIAPPAVTPAQTQAQNNQIASLDQASDLVAKVAPAGSFKVTTVTPVANTSTPALGTTGIDSLVGANELLIDATGSAGFDVFAVNLAFTKGTTVVLQGAESAVLAAPGTVRVEGGSPIIITSDLQAQNVTGGGGNDTLVGTGNDTLTGGAGADVFGFKGAGKFVVTDFNKAADKIAIEMSGVASLADLKTKVTSVLKTPGSITYNFGADTSITLIGVSASDLTSDMIKFQIITGVA